MSLGRTIHACRGFVQSRPCLPIRRAPPGAHGGGPGGPKTPKRPTEEHGDENSPSSWPGPLFLFLSGAASLSMVSFPPPAQAKDDDIEKYVDTVMATAGPILTTLGFSGFIGLCVGKALKAVSGCIAIAVGLTFVGVQLFAYQTGKKLDFGSWEDKGWFQKDELSDAMKSGLRMLTQGVPSVAGFLAGLALGFKW